MDTDKGVAWRLYRMVKEAAERQGMSDVELNRRSGVSRATVHKLQHQANPPRRHTVVALAGALGLDVDDAIRASRGEDPAPETHRAFEDPAAQAIWDLPLPEEERRRFLTEYWARLGSSDQRRRTG